MKNYFVFWGLVCFFSLCAIIFAMDTWGSLPKNQTDPTTIDAEISAAIAAHNSDPDAHTAAGQSIDLHRVNDVLDHPAGSALADKWTMSEMDFTTLFENLTPFIVHGNCYQQFPGVFLYPTSSGDTNYGGISISGEDQNLSFDVEKPSMIQFAFVPDTNYGGKINIKMGWNPSVFHKDGMGLEIVDGVATFWTADEAGTNINTLAWPTYSDAGRVVVRMQNVPDEAVVKIYINGELLGTLVWHDPTNSDPLHISFAVSKTGIDDTTLVVLNLFFTLSPD